MGFLDSVLEGLKTWGDGFLNEKTRQIKKGEELEAAIKYLRPNYK